MKVKKGMIKKVVTITGKAYIQNSTEKPVMLTRFYGRAKVRVADALFGELRRILPLAVPGVSDESLSGGYKGYNPVAVDGSSRGTGITASIEEASSYDVKITVEIGVPVADEILRKL